MINVWYINFISIFKLALLHELIQTSNAILTVCFAETDQFILKIIWKFKVPKIANTILKIKNSLGGLTPLDFKTYKMLVIKTARWCATGIRTDIYVTDKELRSKKYALTLAVK